MNLIRIALFNIKKKKKNVISLVILLILAGLFLNIGANITCNISTFFNNKSEELHGPHYAALFENSKYNPVYSEFLKNDERVTESETSEVIYMESAEWQNESNSGDKIPFSTIVENMDSENKLDGYKVVEKGDIEDGVYLPISLKGFGYKLGDIIKITFKNNEYKYKVAGFFETTIFGTRTCGIYKIYLKDELYNELYNQVGGAKLISARMKESYMADLVSKDFDRKIKSIVTSTDNSQSIVTFTYDGLATANILTTNMEAVFLVIFSGIITIICLLVIRFKIKNDIQDNLINIGTLGALGFTSKQICRIYIIEFTILSLFSSIIGTALSYAVMPLLSNSISNMVGLLWPNNIHLVIDLIEILIICTLVLLISYMCASVVKKYPPVIAFHGGMKSNNFKKNHFKLITGNFNINIKLALKRFASDLNHNIVMGIIISIVTFAVIFCSVIYISFAADYNVLTKLVGFEMCSFEITTTKNTDALELADQISKMNEVRKTNVLDYEKINVEGEEVDSQICGDFNKLETLNVYEGRFPKYENEIAMTGVLAEKFNKNIGDTVILQSAGYSGKYIITGFLQTMSNGGKMCLLNIDGIKNIMTGYSPKTINVYLNDYKDMNKAINAINNKYGNFENTDIDKNDKYSETYKIAKEKISNALKQYDVNSLQYAVMFNGKIIVSGSSNEYKIEKIQDIRKDIDSSLGPIINGINGLTTIISVSTVLIIILILSLMIKAMIIKRKVEFGVLKSIGYTTWQLMFQIALSFMPTVILGTVAGTIVGASAVNPLLTAALHVVGISKFNASINVPILLMINVLIIVFTFIVAMFDAYKVRKISVYELLTE